MSIDDIDDVDLIALYLEHLIGMLVDEADEVADEVDAQYVDDELDDDIILTDAQLQHIEADEVDEDMSQLDELDANEYLYLDTHLVADII